MSSRIRRAGVVFTGAGVAALSSPGAVLAQDADGRPEGTEVSPLWATLVTLVVIALLVTLVVRHRKGRTEAIERLAKVTGRLMGMPGWAALPVLVAGVALILAALGMYWGFAIRLDEGASPVLFANAAAYQTLIGLVGMAVAGLLALTLPRHKPGPTAVEVRGGWATIGAFPMLVCGVIGLFAFLFDDTWHGSRGPDVTLWSPTHLVMIATAALFTLSLWILLAEGHRSADFNDFPERPGFYRAQELAVAGAFLIALSALQAEFDFSVPQFRLDWHPILVTATAGIGLVAARVAIGRGGALGAAIVFLVVRGLLSLWVGPLTGHSTLHFPLYLVEAVVVEAVATRVPRERPVYLGIYSGLGIGTLGLAAEWVWTHVWFDLPWTESMVPEAIIAALLVAVAGGIIGGFLGRSLAAPWIQPLSRPSRFIPAAAVVILVVAIWATPTGEGNPVRATIELTDVTPPPQRTANALVRLTPPNSAKNARWLTLTSWQGGKTQVDRLKRVDSGVFRSSKPVALSPDSKTVLRLEKGSALQSAALSFPADPDTGAQAIVAPATLTRDLVGDRDLLAQERKATATKGRSVFAYLLAAVVGLALMVSLVKRLRRFDHVGEQLRMAAGSEVHETKIGARFAHAAAERGDDSEDGQDDGAKTGSGSRSESS